MVRVLGILVVMKDILYRTTFNNQARLYHEARPEYPEEIFDALVSETHLSTNAQLLEIGPGTGQATLPMAERGYDITAIELGEQLATVAKDELKYNQNVEIITGAFEEIELSEESFDLVYSATAFHWIDPAVKFNKSHKLLKQDGHLAIIRTCHIITVDTQIFFEATQSIYKKYTDIAEKAAKSRVLDIVDIKPDILDEELFRPVFFKVFPMQIVYSTEKYIKLLNTFSETIAMQEEERSSFLNEMDELIENEFNGNITEQYGIPLTIGKKL